MKLMRRIVPFIIWLIVISFALWGIENVFLSLQEESKGVGKVFGKTVSFKTFQDALKSAELFSQRSPDEKPDIDQLEASAWQNIVLLHQAEQEQISASDAEVRAEIERFFTADGSQFNPEFYKAWVGRVAGESPRLFEERIRDALRIRKLIEQHQNIDSTMSDEERAKAAEAFSGWWQNLMKEADIQKFGKPEPKNPEN